MNGKRYPEEFKIESTTNLSLPFRFSGTGNDLPVLRFTIFNTFGKIQFN